jgi:hypothetical protein
LSAMMSPQLANNSRYASFQQFFFFRILGTSPRLLTNLNRQSITLQHCRWYSHLTTVLRTSSNKHWETPITPTQKAKNPERKHQKTIY